MITAFLLGLLAVIAEIAIIVLSILSIKWLAEQFMERLKKNKKHSIVFVKTNEVVEKAFAQKVSNTPMLTKEEQKALSKAPPYVIADYDPEIQELSEFLGISPDTVEETIAKQLSDKDNLIVVEAKD